METLKTMNKTYLAAIAVVIIVVVSYGGYTYYQNTQKETQKAERYQRWVTWSRTLTVGSTSGTFHPGIDIGTGDVNYLSGYNRAGKLIWVDPDDINIFHPHTAESWAYKINPAGEAYIEYKLKQGLMFPDGTEITSEDIKYCWELERYDMPEREAHRETYHRYCHQTGWSRLETPDKYTLWQFMPEDNQNFIPQPFAFLHALYHAFTISQESTEKYALEQNDIKDFVNQVGWGPFLLEDYVVDEYYTMVPWEDYPENPLGGNAGPTKVTQLDKVIVVSYADPTSMRMALEIGQIDIASSSLLRSDLVDLDEDPGIVVEHAPMIGGGALLHMNYRPEFAPLNDIRVRRAIFLATDPQEYVDKLLFGTGEVMNTPVRPFQPYFLPVGEEMRRRPLEERIAEAKELLAEAGFPDGFSTQLWTGMAETSRERATITQAQLKKIGISIEIKQVESGVYGDMKRDGKLAMFYRGWTLDYNDPDSELWYLLHSTSTKQAIHMGYNDSHTDYLLERGKAIFDPEGDPPERREIYEELQRKIWDDCISVPIYYSGRWEAHRTWVKDYKIWTTTHTINMGLWNAYKEIPADWETSEPPF